MWCSGHFNSVMCSVISTTGQLSLRFGGSRNILQIYYISGSENFIKLMTWSAVTCRRAIFFVAVAVVGMFIGAFQIS